MQPPHGKYLSHMANHLLFHNAHALPLRCNNVVHSILGILEIAALCCQEEEHLRRKMCRFQIARATFEAKTSPFCGELVNESLE